MVKQGCARDARPAAILLRVAPYRNQNRHPETLPWSLTKQVPAGDAPLGDGGFHGADGGREDVGLLEDLGQLGAVQGTEGSGVVLLSALVELQRRKLIAPGLGVPVLVLERGGGQLGTKLPLGLERGMTQEGTSLSTHELHVQEGQKPPGYQVY